MWGLIYCFTKTTPICNYLDALKITIGSLYLLLFNNFNKPTTWMHVIPKCKIISLVSIAVLLHALINKGFLVHRHLIFLGLYTIYANFHALSCFVWIKLHYQEGLPFNLFICNLPTLPQELKLLSCQQPWN